MGYDTTGTNDKAIIAVAVGSALALAGLIPLFHNYFDMTVGARQAEATREGSYPNWVVTEGGETRVLTAEDAAAYTGDGVVRRASTAETTRLEAQARLAQGRAPIDQAMSQIASGNRGNLRPTQNDTVDAVQGWNAMENADGAAAAREALGARAAQQAAEAAAAAQAAAEAAAAAAEAEAAAPRRPGRPR